MSTRDPRTVRITYEVATADAPPRTSCVITPPADMRAGHHPLPCALCGGETWEIGIHVPEGSQRGDGVVAYPVHAACHAQAGPAGVAALVRRGMALRRALGLDAEATP